MKAINIETRNYHPFSVVYKLYNEIGRAEIGKLRKAEHLRRETPLSYFHVGRAFFFTNFTFALLAAVAPHIT